MLNISHSVNELKLELNRDMIEDIIDNECQITFEGHCAQENYMHTFMAAHFQIEDLILVVTIFDQLQLELRAEKYFTRDAIENYKKDPKKYASGIYIDENNEDMNEDLETNAYYLFYYDTAQNQFTVMGIEDTNNVNIVTYDDIKVYNINDDDTIEIKYFEEERLTSMTFKINLNKKES